MNILKNLFTNRRIPLGRWRNCGEYMDYQKLNLKEVQKKERVIMKEKNIDPYIQKQKKIKTSLSHNKENEYMLPFFL